ncbi:glycosyltransferase, partial [Pseudomonas aeruginosa]|uniref:glycosyltransferase n=1 Tax=Pseudomonas aeruginosa TaxID=287 RepID=UPI0031B6A120
THRVKPFVSVVTPTWNRGAFLPYLLYMYRYQDYPADRRELIILDDSPQSHQHIIDRLTNGTPESFNIRYIHHPEKLPLGKKRNMLNELARGFPLHRLGHGQLGQQATRRRHAWV